MSAFSASQSTQTTRQPRTPQRRRPEQLAAPSLETLLATFPRLPTRTAILGVGRDGLPVLFDLQDARPGAILITADRGAGKTSLLQTLLLSTLALSLPHEAQFVIVAADLSRWEWLASDPDAGRYLLDIVSPQEPAAAGWVMRLAKMAAARQKGLQSGPTILLLVDGVEFVAEMDAEVRSAFEWLLDHGAAAGIWPVATLAALRLAGMQNLADLFPTQIVGRLSSREAAHWIGLAGTPIEKALQTGFRFAVQVNADWITFDLPAPVVRQSWR